jgi:hypothetical protein
LQNKKEELVEKLEKDRKDQTNTINALMQITIRIQDKEDRDEEDQDEENQDEIESNEENTDNVSSPMTQDLSNNKKKHQNKKEC